LPICWDDHLWNRPGPNPTIAIYNTGIHTRSLACSLGKNSTYRIGSDSHTDGILTKV
jgi:hypothetical protein